ncbi:EAL domain-containing protein [Bradyrhizobium diazoefficiens]|nr:EAL domain-containing protein [Bradyrhizobium diazoefficiens]
MPMPIAERSGSIAQTDDWVLMDACRQAASWDQPLRVAVNVSAAQFRRTAALALRHSAASPAATPSSEKASGRAM